MSRVGASEPDELGLVYDRAVTRRRQLSEEEQALWRGFARFIKPLRRLRDAVPERAADAAAADERKSPAPASTPGALPRVKASAAPLPPKTPPLAPLDRRLKQRVARGSEPIDARLDLHGYTQARAHAALLAFLQRAQRDGARVALVVTGKGGARGGALAQSERGVLKRQVPIWLALPEFRSFVLGFEVAHVGHGGEGALYVRLRRQR
jgi:DNA-nicking Smr family endonuclease